ncbi:MAG: acetyl-CoA carboxylase biotin carboxylase subunit [Chloroflexi bacterium]|nr:acetyl-CoA carboxylase biotin carboxylase subunit [Chloroflexota bacterium]
MFDKILIANRGEIAVRIIRTCKEMGIRTVAIHSDIDAEALHVKLADEAHCVGPAEAAQSYLNMKTILNVAEASGAQAIHPGYGFLAENPDFAEMCEQRGIAFIGPPSRCMYKAKPKHKARQLMSLINIPVAPGSGEAIEDSTEKGWKQALEVATTIGFPVVVKPTGTGGGIGMVVAKDGDQLKNAIEYAEKRGKRAFGISAFYIEKFLPGIRHVEFQVLADRKGNVIHLGDRDCSIQRRFQKLVEETPCPVMTPFLRMKMAVAAMEIARALQYVNAMTVEFLYSPETQEFYFNEINSRLQVEHCITELVTRVDIVKQQIKIAAGEQLGYTQDDIRFGTHAIECRINAEDPLHDFRPSSGTISRLRFPHGLGVRIDEGVYEGYEVPFYYDSLLVKLAAWGKTRDEAIGRMRRAINEMVVEGIQTTLPFHRTVMDDEQFQKGQYTTAFVEEQEILGKLKHRSQHK